MRKLQNYLSKQSISSKNHEKMYFLHHFNKAFKLMFLNFISENKFLIIILKLLSKQILSIVHK